MRLVITCGSLDAPCVRRLDRRAVLRVLAAAAVAACSPAVGAISPQRQDWPRGRKTPTVRLPAMDGSTWDLAELRGRAVLLNFWASWCEPCRAEMPSLASLARRRQPQGLSVVAVNYRELDPAVRRFLEQTGLDLPIVSDRDGNVAKGFGIHAFPSTVAVDREGRVRFIVLGECDWADPRSEQWVNDLLADPARHRA